MTEPRPRNSSNRPSAKGSGRPSVRLAWLTGSIVLLGTVALSAWFVWIDFKVRRDFETLQWALPARLYARPVELYVGAPVSTDDLIDTVQRLGYRGVDSVSGPGEYSQGDGVVRPCTPELCPPLGFAMVCVCSWINQEFPAGYRQVER